VGGKVELQIVSDSVVCRLYIIGNGKIKLHFVKVFPKCSRVRVRNSGLENNNRADGFLGAKNSGTHKFHADASCIDTAKAKFCLTYRWIQWWHSLHHMLLTPHFAPQQPHASVDAVFRRRLNSILGGAVIEWMKEWKNVFADTNLLQSVICECIV